jgi:putative membrane protein
MPEAFGWQMLCHYCKQNDFCSSLLLMNPLHRNLLIAFFLVMVLSLISPHDLLTWFLEATPALLALLILALTYNSFRLSNLAYVLICAHAIVLLIGAHYTYAEVPLFNWIRDTFHTHRNSYDGVGHFTQGFVPAIIAREVLLRKIPLQRGAWLFFITVCVVFAFSAFYELIEWWVSLATGSAGDAFLGTQGDIWDTQKDMALCLIGSVLSLILLSGLHDRSMNRLGGRVEAGGTK